MYHGFGLVGYGYVKTAYERPPRLLRGASCMWGCRMPVEMIIDHWNPGKMKYRFETFCYGPKNCRFYHPGKIRTVPGRKGMVWQEEDWIDEDETSHWDEGEGGIK